MRGELDSRRPPAHTIGLIEFSMPRMKNSWVLLRIFTFVSRPRTPPQLRGVCQHFLFRNTAAQQKVVHIFLNGIRI
jgi:hypothetical protein